MAECSSMAAAAQCEQLCLGGRAVSRLGKAPLAERQNLIGTEDQAARMEPADDGRLFARQQQRDRVGGLRPRLIFKTPFVDIGRRDRKFHTSRFEQCPPRGAARRHDERIGSKPHRHGPEGQSAKGHGVTAPRAGAVRRATPAPRPPSPRSSGASRRSAANCCARRGGATPISRSPPPPCRCICRRRGGP